MRSCVLLVAIALVGCESPDPKASSKAVSAKSEKAKSEKAKAKAKEEPSADKADAPDKVAKVPAFAPNDTVLNQTVEDIDGKPVKLSDYRGKALMVVNTASECGFTPQYADLQELYAKYKDRGFEVLAFPSNDFGGQEPGSPEEIKAFVDKEFSIDFPMFAKVSAKGPDKSEIYKVLTEQTGDGIKGEVKWNFTKFIVSPDGKVVARFESPVKPTSPEVVKTLEGVLPST